MEISVLVSWIYLVIINRVLYPVHLCTLPMGPSSRRHSSPTPIILLNSSSPSPPTTRPQTHNIKNPSTPITTTPNDPPTLPFAPPSNGTVGPPPAPTVPFPPPILPFPPFPGPHPSTPISPTSSGNKTLEFLSLTIHEQTVALPSSKLSTCASVHVLPGSSV
jgi:hypothetical protein